MFKMKASGTSRTVMGHVKEMDSLDLSLALVYGGAVMIQGAQNASVLRDNE
jgi:hypothetical protein